VKGKAGGDLWEGVPAGPCAQDTGMGQREGGRERVGAC
jgi:hypothetical protein